MDQLISILDNCLLQGAGYGIAVIGVAFAFRIIKYPDLTPDGSFLMGAVVFSSLVSAGQPWVFSALVAVLAGACAGAVTALMHVRIGVNRLLSGILTSMMCYSIAFWVLSGKPNLNISDLPSMFSWAQMVDKGAKWSEMGFHLGTIGVSLVIALAVVAALYVLLTSDFGIVIRAIGENESLIEEFGRVPGRYHLIGLSIANGLTALAGCLISARQGFADVNMGFGVIITLVAALVIGEESIRLMGLNPALKLSGRVLSGLVGAFVYFLLYLMILRASILGYLPVRIQPTDLKLLSAVIVIIFIAIRFYSREASAKQEEVLPL
ncbi:MAG: hypothetical protein JRJ29_01490 [Deltaproteobacteria bacterium]|nr:hypothetical protein [Deltaproteobacteria bacterium]